MWAGQSSLTNYVGRSVEHGVLQCVGVCRSVLQCIEVCGSLESPMHWSLPLEIDR